MKRELSKKEQKIIGISSIVIFVVFSVCMLIFIGLPIVRTAKNPDEFRAWIDSMGIWGKLGYIGICFLQVLVAIIPGGPIEVAGGYAFGHVEATVLSTIGLGLGSITVFLLVRKFGIKLLEVFFSKEKIEELDFLKTTKQRDLWILLLFLIPGTPKDLLCFFCGLTDMPLWIFALMSTLGRIPAAWISSVGGSAAGEKSYTIAIVIVVLIIVFTLAGIIAYKKLVKKGKEKNSEN